MKRLHVNPNFAIKMELLQKTEADCCPPLIFQSPATDFDSTFYGLSLMRMNTKNTSVGANHDDPTVHPEYPDVQDEHESDSLYLAYIRFMERAKSTVLASLHREDHRSLLEQLYAVESPREFYSALELMDSSARDRYKRMLMAGYEEALQNADNSPSQGLIARLVKDDDCREQTPDSSN